MRRICIEQGCRATEFQPARRARFHVSIPVIALLLLTGCAGYKLGPTNGLAAGERSVEIVPFADRTMEPGLGDAVTTALRRNLQRDGTYRLATHGGADVVVTGVLTHFGRRELSFESRDVLTVRDYREIIRARVTARDTVTGKVIFERTFTGYTLVRVGSDLASDERQAIPLMADDLARDVTEQLVDGSW